MMLAIDGAVALVTGAASGIGRALAIRLAQGGSELVLVDRNAEALASTLEEVRALGVRVSSHLLDVSDAAAVARLPDQVERAHGRLTILVNNAGVALVGTFRQLSIAEFDWLVGINLSGVVRMTKAFLPLLEREQAAQIVNISSMYGLIAPAAQSAYATSKFAVRGFTESLRHELGRGPVQASLVLPGGVQTAIARTARIADAIDQDAGRRASLRFERGYFTGPQTAAACILRGIERRRPRIIVGLDAYAMDLAARLFPASYWRLAGLPFGWLGGRLVSSAPSRAPSCAFEPGVTLGTGAARPGTHPTPE